MKPIPGPALRKFISPADRDPAPTAALVRTACLVSAYVGRNRVRAADLPGLIHQVHSCFLELGQRSKRGSITVATPPADVWSSVGKDFIISFVDGKPYKTLKRHLTANGLNPDRYRTRYGLPKEYPMVSPNYSAKRAQIARRIGLGSRAA